jgi:tripartite-type tricarboxylate transporter receptor subunit TctC
MHLSRRGFLHLASNAAAVATGAAAGHARSFPIPGKPVRIIVPFAAGGSDHQARVIGQAVAETIGTSVIIENRPGAASQIGTREVQRADPDGHTLLYTIPTILQLPPLLRSPSWNVFTDFTPITYALRSHTVLTAHVSAPFKTVAELIAYAKANPGKLSYASFGIGTSAHLNGELLKRRAGIDIVHVPYRGSGEAMRDHLSGNVLLSFDGPTNATANMQTGRVKILAAAAETRNKTLPDVPTLRELGYDIGRWGYNGFWGPAGLPPAVVAVLHDHIARALARPDIRDVLEKTGNEVVALPPAEMLREAQRAHDHWSKVISELDIKID